MQDQTDSDDTREKDEHVPEGSHAADFRTKSTSNGDDSRDKFEDSLRPGVSRAYVAELETRTRAAEQQVRAIQSRFEELRNELQRQTDETRERLNRVADERALSSKTESVISLLPVIDNLERALKTARESGSIEPLLDGLDRTLLGFESALSAIGVEFIRSVGELFDPEVHEAVDTVDVRDSEDGIVTREYSRGYKLGDRLLRPARVQVGRSSTSSRRKAAGEPFHG
jgi:molecular chaperone GrpE